MDSAAVVSFSDSLIITLFSMLIVFIGLVIIALLISGLKFIGNKDNSSIKKEEEAKVKTKPVADKLLVEDDEELVAVIAAAIAASLGVQVEDFNIKNIKRTNSSDPWSQAGLTERLINKL